MEILILKYSSGNLLRIILDEKLEKVFKDDMDSFIDFLSDKYQFSINDIFWMAAKREDEIHYLSKELTDKEFDVLTENIINNKY